MEYVTSGSKVVINNKSGYIELGSDRYIFTVIEHKTNDVVESYVCSDIDTGSNIVIEIRDGFLGIVVGGKEVLKQNIILGGSYGVDAGISFIGRFYNSIAGFVAMLFCKIMRFIQKVYIPVIVVGLLAAAVLFGYTEYSNYKSKKEDIALRTFEIDKILGNYNLEVFYLNGGRAYNSSYSSGYSYLTNYVNINPYMNLYERTHDSINGRIFIKNKELIFIMDSNRDDYFSDDERKVFNILSIRSKSDDENDFNRGVIEIEGNIIIDVVIAKGEYNKGLRYYLKFPSGNNTYEYFLYKEYH